jgi:hypothetical protein
VETAVADYTFLSFLFLDKVYFSTVPLKLAPFITPSSLSMKFPMKLPRSSRDHLGVKDGMMMLGGRW